MFLAWNISMNWLYNRYFVMFIISLFFQSSYLFTIYKTIILILSSYGPIHRCRQSLVYLLIVRGNYLYSTGIKLSIKMLPKNGGSFNISFLNFFCFQGLNYEQSKGNHTDSEEKIYKYLRFIAFILNFMTIENLLNIPLFWYMLSYSY